MTLKSDPKFEENLILGSKNDMKNLVNFNASGGKSENFHFDVLLLSKVYYVWAKKMCHEKWLQVSKMKSGIWWIFTQVVERNVK